MISIIIPSYHRSDKIRAVVENALSVTTHCTEILVVVEREGSEVPDYCASLYGLPKVHVLMNARSKNYAGAVNTAASRTHQESSYVFLGADDVKFSMGWDTPAVSHMRALEHIKVVGTNDLFNGYVLQGLHATHYLVDKDYLQVPGGVADGLPGEVLYEGYDHNYTDTEFIGTAKARAVFAPCLASVVEHIGWTTADYQDATKAKTNLNLDTDSQLYLSRKHLWENLSK